MSSIFLTLIILARTSTPFRTRARHDNSLLRDCSLRFHRTKVGQVSLAPSIRPSDSAVRKISVPHYNGQILGSILRIPSLLEEVVAAGFGQVPSARHRKILPPNQRQQHSLQVPFTSLHHSILSRSNEAQIPFDRRQHHPSRSTPSRSTISLTQLTINHHLHQLPP